MVLGKLNWPSFSPAWFSWVVAGISQVGSFLSSDIEQTAGGIGDPAQLVNHSRFTGQPYTPPNNGDSGNADNGNNGNGNNGDNGNGNNGNGNNGNGNGNNGNGNGRNRNRPNASPFW